MCSRPGGIFLLEFANKRNAKSVLRYWLGKQSWNPFSLQPVEFAALNFDFHPAAVRGWLRQLGFEIQRTLTVSHFRAGILKRVVPVDVLVFLDSLLQWTGEWWQLTPSVFMRARLGASSLATSRMPAAPLALFKCPACGHRPLTEGPAGLKCPSCGRQYPVMGEILRFSAASGNAIPGAAHPILNLFIRGTRRTRNSARSYPPRASFSQSRKPFSLGCTFVPKVAASFSNNSFCSAVNLEGISTLTITSWSPR